jgi:DNA polymerase III alpha subunit
MDAGIKPIIGCEVYVAPDSRFKKDTKTKTPEITILYFSLKTRKVTET